MRDFVPPCTAGPGSGSRSPPESSAGQPLPMNCQQLGDAVIERPVHYRIFGVGNLVLERPWGPQTGCDRPAGHACLVCVTTEIRTWNAADRPGHREPKKPALLTLDSTS